MNAMTNTACTAIRDVLRGWETPDKVTDFLIFLDPEGLISLYVYTQAKREGRTVSSLIKEVSESWDIPMYKVHYACFRRQKLNYNDLPPEARLVEIRLLRYCPSPFLWIAYMQHAYKTCRWIAAYIAVKEGAKVAKVADGLGITRAYVYRICKKIDKYFDDKYLEDGRKETKA